MKHLILAIMAVIGSLACMAGDDHRYRTITMDDGLPSNAVRNIVQDRYGYIWLGTDNGLCRYDGTRVQSYRIPLTGMGQYVSALLGADDGIYVGTEQGVFLLPFGGAAFERLPMDISSTVTHLSIDKEGQLWTSTMDDGVWCYAPTTGQLRHYDLGFPVAQVFADNDNQLWAVTNWGQPAVSRLNRLHDRFEDAQLRSGLRFESLCMMQTSDGQLWLGTWEQGLLRLHADGSLEQVLSPAATGVGLHIHTLFERSADCICIGCDDGALCFNPKNGQWHRLMEQGRLTDRFVYAITADTEGGLWTGTFYGGANYMAATGSRFEGRSAETGLAGNVIARFCEDRDGHVWIASDDGGLMCYQPANGQLLSYAQHQELSRLNVHALALKGDDLWIGTYTAGVYVLSLPTGRLTHHMPDGSDGSLHGTSSYAICHDSQGRTWVATMENLDLYDDANGRFTRIGEIDALTIDIDETMPAKTAGTETVKGVPQGLWLSTQGGGLWHCDPQTRKLTQYRHNEGDSHSLPDDQVNCAYADQSGRLWVGTAHGLCYLDNQEGRFTRVRLDVPSQNVTGIVEDQGVLWLSTERGIVRYSPTQDGGVQRFTRHDGLVSEQFQPNATMKASDGRIYMGTTGGMNFFYPYQIKANSVMPPVYITSLQLLRQSEQALRSEQANALPQDLSLTTDLELGYRDARMLTFSFAALSYCSPEKNQYAYMMEGFDRDWNYVGSQTRATYTNLPAGTYTFRVRATNNDGIWSQNEARLRLVVHPPFWWSWWARLFYLLLIVAAVWYYVHLRLRRAERQHQEELRRLAEAKERDAREARLNFFTMVAHEIRTPVSLIIGPLEKVKKELKVNSEESDKSASLSTFHSSFETIDRNAHRLLELVNQLLDFRKVEQQSLVMHFAPHNVRQLLEAVCVRFAPTFEQGGKQFSVAYPDDRFTAIVDSEALTKVVSNLLTNANKYTKTLVDLRCIVSADGEQFTISVRDDGVGISEADRRRIFEPFFQAQTSKPGTGIGLNIVKNIVDMHHGTISVESQEGQGSTFIVTLPVKQSDFSVECRVDSVEFATALPSSGTGTPVGNSKLSTLNSILKDGTPVGNSTLNTLNSTLNSTLLIVDDSDEMVTFLADNFSANYQVVTASDGIEALSQLAHHEVSVIISDWMMPRMDGAELCRRVRSNPLTSHIPFVMLTAKTDDGSKIEGMNVGADIYIEKPFSVEYVEACIANIVQMRRRLMEKFTTQPYEPVPEVAVNPLDNEFLAKMNAIIEENVANTELSVNFLADKMNISRSGLFAKIKSLTDVTPNEMIQVVRLKRAAQLLLEGRYRVSEVGYMVGFSSPSYFSKCFQKQFGQKPAEYAKKSSSPQGPAPACWLLALTLMASAAMPSPAAVVPDGSPSGPAPVSIEKRAEALYEQTPQRALALIDSAQETGVLPPFRADLLRARLFSGSITNPRQEQALQLSEALLLHDSVKASPAFQREVLEILVNASRMRHDDQLWMRYATQLCSLLRQQDDEDDALRTEAEIGLVLTHLGQHQRGLAKIDHSIDRLDGQRRVRALNALVLSLKRKIVVLRETGRHADILPVAQHIQDRLDDYSRHPDDYDDHSPYLPKSAEARADYCDFYGAQAIAFKAAARAATGDDASARRELQAFAATNYGHSLDGQLMIAPTLSRLGLYDRMLAIYDEAQAKMGSDTLRNDYADILLARAEAAEAQGRLAQSIAYHKRHAALVDTLNERLHRSDAQRYAARYHAQEQQIEINQREAEATHIRIIAIALAIGLVGVVGFALYFFWQKRSIDRKNRVLVAQISDALYYKKRYEELEKHVAQTATDDAAPDVAPSCQVSEGAPQGASPAPSTDLSAMTDEQLFQHISHVVLQEKLYLNPLCDRQMIINRFGISEKRVGAAFSKGSSYKSVASFIRDSRLEYACQLLRQTPEMSIGSIAQASGFSNHTRFTADFKMRYSVSPTYFRQMAH